jgi:calmodulin
MSLSHRSFSLDFEEFVQLIENQKAKSEKYEAGDEMVEAFVACGGNRDRTGNIRREALTRIIKDEFGLEIDLDVSADE